MLLLTACANEQNKSIKQLIVSCNYAANLESVQKVPVPAGDIATNQDYLLLQDWALNSVAVNKRNKALRKYTAECLHSVIVNN